MATKKPCPGCGEVEYHRKTTEVCTQCARDIADGQAVREYFDKKEHKAEIRVAPEVPHYFPYIQEGEDFKAVFLTLVNLISIPSRNRGSTNLIGGQDGGYDNTETSRIFPAGVPVALAELYEAVKDVACQCEAEGRKSMLQSLGSMREDMEKFVKLIKEAEKIHEPDDK